MTPISVTHPRYNILVIEVIDPFEVLLKFGNSIYGWYHPEFSSGLIKQSKVKSLLENTPLVPAWSPVGDLKENKVSAYVNTSKCMQKEDFNGKLPG